MKKTDDIIKAKCEYCDNAIVASGPDSKSVLHAAKRHLDKVHPKAKK
jgi:hypothetical protein